MRRPFLFGRVGRSILLAGSLVQERRLMDSSPPALLSRETVWPWLTYIFVVLAYDGAAGVALSPSLCVSPLVAKMVFS